MEKYNVLLKLERIIHYQFQDIQLLYHALTHSSYANEHHFSRTQNNERLEFLGDAVLEVVCSELLYLHYPGLSEGELTKKRASLVCEPALSVCAREISLGEYLLLGKGEEATGGRYRDSILADAVEAMIGAIYLDGGFANAKEFILAFVLNDVDHKQFFYDSKTTLQELVQGNYTDEITYVLVKEEGPDHDKSFSVEVRLGEKVIGNGQGRTKKAAEQQAAYNAILLLQK